jgi:hypothetical protein
MCYTETTLNLREKWFDLYCQLDCILELLAIYHTQI